MAQHLLVALPCGVPQASLDAMPCRACVSVPRHQDSSSGSAPHASAPRWQRAASNSSSAVPAAAAGQGGLVQQDPEGQGAVVKGCMTAVTPQAGAQSIDDISHV